MIVLNLGCKALGSLTGTVAGSGHTEEHTRHVFGAKAAVKSCMQPGVTARNPDPLHS